MVDVYKVNQVVSYGSQGVYKISEIADKNITGKIIKYYVLKSVKGNNSIVYVPVDNEKLVSRIRPVLTAEEVHEIINEMPNEEISWIDNDDERKNKFREVLSQSNPLELAKMIRTIYYHRRELTANGKKLHSSDERFFNDAERVLYNEFSIALKISSDSVESFIIEQIGEDETADT